MCEEGEEEIPSPNKNIIDSTAKKLHKIIEVESQSKISTAYTDGPGEFKIKIGGSTGKKLQRKLIPKTKNVVTTKKQSGAVLDEETKSILDNQLDQLIIEKPAALKNAEGKDRSLKEAFLRRPPNN